jgi:hypothetical protein
MDHGRPVMRIELKLGYNLQGPIFERPGDDR